MRHASRDRHSSRRRRLGGGRSRDRAHHHGIWAGNLTESLYISVSGYIIQVCTYGYIYTCSVALRQLKWKVPVHLYVPHAVMTCRLITYYYKQVWCIIRTRKSVLVYISSTPPPCCSQTNIYINPTGFPLYDPPFFAFFFPLLNPLNCPLNPQTLLAPCTWDSRLTGSTNGTRVRGGGETRERRRTLRTVPDPSQASQTSTVAIFAYSSITTRCLGTSDGLGNWEYVEMFQVIDGSRR